jgi:hypothetical protein
MMVLINSVLQYVSHDALLHEENAPKVVRSADFLGENCAQILKSNERAWLGPEEIIDQGGGVIGP